MTPDAQQPGMRSDEDELPPATAFADVYTELCALVDEYLERPVGSKINTWEDGSVRVQIWHQRSPDERAVLYYHSDRGEIEYAVEHGDSVTSRETVRSVEPPPGSAEDTTRGGGESPR
jgi:hypothetical protein